MLSSWFLPCSQQLFSLSRSGSILCPGLVFCISSASCEGPRAWHRGKNSKTYSCPFLPLTPISVSSFQLVSPRYCPSTLGLVPVTIFYQTIFSLEEVPWSSPVLPQPWASDSWLLDCSYPPSPTPAHGMVPNICSPSPFGLDSRRQLLFRVIASGSSIRS